MWFPTVRPSAHSVPSAGGLDRRLIAGLRGQNPAQRRQQENDAADSEGPLIGQLLGQHPDAGRINRYFLFYEATVVGLSYEWQPAIGVSAAIEAGVVAHNASIGLRVRF